MFSKGPWNSEKTPLLLRTVSQARFIGAKTTIGPASVTSASHHRTKANTKSQRKRNSSSAANYPELSSKGNSHTRIHYNINKLCFLRIYADFSILAITVSGTEYQTKPISHSKTNNSGEEAFQSEPWHWSRILKVIVSCCIKL